MRRIGLLGGTFDPPHAGHLLLAETALVQLQLDSVLWLPVGQPTHKGGVSAESHRTNMLTLYLKNHSQYQIDLTDVERAAPHYTSTLLPLLHQKYPATEFWLLIGGDSLRDFHRWYEPDSILTQCRLGVLPRPGATINWEILAQFPTLQSRVDLLSSDGIDISSTTLRQPDQPRTATSAAVRAYIEQHNLYTL